MPKLEFVDASDFALGDLVAFEWRLSELPTKHWNCMLTKVKL